MKKDIGIKTNNFVLVPPLCGKYNIYWENLVSVEGVLGVLCHFGFAQVGIGLLFYKKLVL